ncbi:nucleic acid-binding protein [Collybia nuda]|uniref:Nucleic acid-binding protein n=1 Tax=Collybia nuda TaxID=64659 RepID=A0A9P5YA89_9AGAR|nr:nucleic acid-binding protein [Collybia nuda]
MSFSDVVAKLSPPVKELVILVTENGVRHVGQSEKDQAEVTEWIEKATSSDLDTEASLQSINSLLLPRTYLVNNYLTAADVAIYGALHPTFSKLQPFQYYTHPSLTRYFDHIQSLPVVRRSADAVATPFTLLPFNLENAPKPERKVEPPKKKEKKPTGGEKAIAETLEASKPSTSAPGPESKVKKEKKEKKKDASEENAKKKATGGGKAAPVDEGEPVPSMIDLRVGHIIDVMKHPDADGLYVEQIDIGEETGPRTVVSGLVNYIPIEEMRDQYLVAVCNLKPANMRGVKSFAMVLCATSKDGKEGGIEFIKPPVNSKPGDRVYFEGAEYESATPLTQLNPKKKIFETIQPGFITLESREAAWVNPTTKSVHRIRTKDGVCEAPTLIGASLS